MIKPPNNPTPLTNYYLTVKISLSITITPFVESNPTPMTARKGITTLDIQMFTSIIIMLLIMNIKHGIEKHIPFVDYITINFLSVGKE